MTGLVSTWANGVIQPEFDNDEVLFLELERTEVPRVLRGEGSALTPRGVKPQGQASSRVRVPSTE